MAFVTRCVERGSAPAHPYGFRGSEFIAVEMAPLSRKDAKGVSKELTDEDFIAPEFAPVFQVLPNPDELSPLSYSTADYLLQKNKPMVFANWKDRALHVDTRAVRFLGILHDMLADPSVARSDPDSGAQIAALTRGTSTAAIDDRGFRMAHHGMLVEYVPTDSGYAPEGHEHYRGCIYRPVYPEQVMDTPMFIRNMPNHIACMEAMKYFTDSGIAVLPDKERAAVLMHMWDKTKLPSMKYCISGARVKEHDKTIEKILTLFNIAKANFNTISANVIDNSGGRYEQGVLNPYLITSTLTDLDSSLGRIGSSAPKNSDAFNYAFIGSPQLPSLTHHFISSLKEGVHDMFPESDNVWVWHESENLSVAGKPYAGLPYKQVGTLHCVDLGVMDYTEYERKRAACEANYGTHGYLAVNPVKFMELHSLMSNSAELDDTIEAVTNSAAITDPGEIAAVKKLADEIHKNTFIERFMNKMNHIFSIDSMPYFMQHAHARRFYKNALTGSDVTKVSETIAVEFDDGSGAKRVNVSLASALGYVGPDAGVLVHEAVGGAALLRHPAIDHIEELLRGHMKRHRTEHDDINYDMFNDVSSYEEVQRRLLQDVPVRRHRIIGKFMAIEPGGGGIIMQLGAPNWVY